MDHLARHGYVHKLKDSKANLWILTAPELLNNLAASFILEARRQPKGLGSLLEERLLGGYEFPELKGLARIDQEILVDSVVMLFLNHNICFRETDPLSSNAYLIFPELINLIKPQLDEPHNLIDDVSYTVSGAVENVYASLVVLLGYTNTFTRTDQWRGQARYEVGRDRFVCGFRQEDEHEGELDFVLFFANNVGSPIKTLFRGLFESFLARMNLTVWRYEPVFCRNGHRLDRTVVRRRIDDGFAFCGDCGSRIEWPKADKPIQLTKEQRKEVDKQRRTADQRSRFEQAVYRLKSYSVDLKISPPLCFISYAWGNPEHEHWIEQNLATDLQKAGIEVELDRWDNHRIGSSIPRFVERISNCDFVVVVGTPAYLTKYNNNNPMGGYVLAAEGDLIGSRMIGSEGNKNSVLPLLLEGDPTTAFPNLLRGRVYADFRQPKTISTRCLNSSSACMIFPIPIRLQWSCVNRCMWQERGVSG